MGLLTGSLIEVVMTLLVLIIGAGIQEGDLNEASQLQASLRSCFPTSCLLTIACGLPAWISGWFWHCSYSARF